MVINTHKGFLNYTHLPFGIAVAPTVFQQTMDTGLQGLLGYLDDINVKGKYKVEHLLNLGKVLSRIVHKRNVSLCKILLSIYATLLTEMESKCLLRKLKQLMKCHNLQIRYDKPLWEVYTQVLTNVLSSQSIASKVS